MKKFFFFLFLFAISYLLFAIFPSPASAASCYPKIVTCGIDNKECPEGTRNAGLCCTDPSECGDTISLPAPAAGAPTPTCGADNSGTPTALGCIPNEPVEAIKAILPWAISVGAGLAFLLFLYGAFTLITAGSDPQKVDSGKSIITSAAAGLIFIILSLVLLKIIGIEILGL